VYELGTMKDERPFFTMKLVKGRTLAALLAERESPAANVRRMIDIFESICQTMGYAHSRGVIHRDLKPANIMVGAFGEVQVMDWGLAKVLSHVGLIDEAVCELEEALTIGREANIPVEISHFKLSGQQNWGRSTQTIGMIKKAREEGLDVTIDQYPYTASSSSLSILLPDEVLSDGRDSVVARLRRKEVRNEVQAYMTKKLRNRKLTHLGYATVAYYRADTTLNGKSIEEINLLWKRKHDAIHEFQTVMDMVSAGGASMIYHGMSEEDVRYIMKYPFNMFASDAGIRVFNEGVPHPRGYGTNARVLGKYVREEKIISFLLTAAEIGSIFKKGATLSAAMGGCQAEIGVASAMAAALVAAAYDASPRVIENAAESALEHHLGMTCDPVAGYVQVPCIERCAFGAVKAWTAWAIASNEIESRHRVDLDATIAAMAETAKDMNSKYKETSKAGLALSVTLC
jgi:tRNA A-37 threonylcarbamoyl transferase component Bud32